MRHPGLTAPPPGLILIHPVLEYYYWGILATLCLRFLVFLRHPGSLAFLVPGVPL